MASDFRIDLNEQQLLAVQHVEGPVLILAGAGSGKTRTITHKIAYLMGQGLARPDEILAVTFTNKAAGEMKGRVESLLGGLPVSPLICTFHSFGVRLLRRHAHRVEYQPDFAICDVDDQKRLFKQLYLEMSLKDEELPLEKARGIIGWAKNRGWTADEYLKRSRDFDAQAIYEVFVAYQNLLRRSNAVDFDDLILLPVRLLEENPDVRRSLGRFYRFLLIDEYQDTNPPQYDLIRLLTTEHQNISAVGDEDQAIYGFRGADIGNILRFEKDFPGARIIKLEQNYRSTQIILDAATAVVSNNVARKDKVLWTRLPKGESIVLFVADDAATEAAYVAEQARRHLEDGLGPVAVLYRTNFQSRQFEEAFRRLSIRYQLVGSVSFYKRKEVRDALAYLRLVLNPDDDISLARVLNEPPRGIGQVTRNRLFQLASARSCSLWSALRGALESGTFSGKAAASLKTFADLLHSLREWESHPLHVALEKILNASGYLKALREDGSEEAANRALNLQELVTVARDWPEGRESWREFLDEAALHADIDEMDEKAEVTLMTLHNAKGLEFPVVFLAGCEEGLFPHSRSIAENDLEEERRLCYVGLTRARKRLYLSYSRRRRFYGRESDEANQPSRFLHEIPSRLVETIYSERYSPAWSNRRQGPVFLGAALQPVAKEKRAWTGKSYDSVECVRRALEERNLKTKESGGLVAGALIVHRTFGRGRVLKVEPAAGDVKVTVQFPGGVKKMLQSYARLKPA
jgi:DNA helicase II / ATP-dependent DNA helicase PcrA